MNYSDIELEFIKQLKQLGGKDGYAFVGTNIYQLVTKEAPKASAGIQEFDKIYWINGEKYTIKYITMVGAGLPADRGELMTKEYYELMTKEMGMGNGRIDN